MGYSCFVKKVSEMNHLKSLRFSEYWRTKQVNTFFKNESISIEFVFKFFLKWHTHALSKDCKLCIIGNFVKTTFDWLPAKKGAATV